MSFQAKDDGKLIELGTVEKGACGVTLSSTQGDFAEWHRRVSTEPPFHEGDVIGFTARGEITRHCSTSAKMLLGVVSRKAVVEGSAPSIAERDLYDTVAYCGVVPVRVVPRVANDIILGVPAMSTCTTRCGGEIFDAAKSPLMNFCVASPNTLPLFVVAMDVQSTAQDRQQEIF